MKKVIYLIIILLPKIFDLSPYPKLVVLLQIEEGIL